MDAHDRSTLNIAAPKHRPHNEFVSQHFSRLHPLVLEVSIRLKRTKSSSFQLTFSEVTLQLRYN